MSAFDQAGLVFADKIAGVDRRRSMTCASSAPTHVRRWRRRDSRPSTRQPARCPAELPAPDEMAHKSPGNRPGRPARRRRLASRASPTLPGFDTAGPAGPKFCIDTTDRARLPARASSGHGPAAEHQRREMAHATRRSSGDRSSCPHFQSTPARIAPRAWVSGGATRCRSLNQRRRRRPTQREQHQRGPASHVSTCDVDAAGGDDLVAGRIHRSHGRAGGRSPPVRAARGRRAPGQQIGIDRLAVEERREHGETLISRHGMVLYVDGW